MTRADRIAARRRAIRRLLEAEPGISNAEIARRLRPRVSRATVVADRRALLAPAGAIANLQDEDGRPVAGQRAGEPSRALTHGAYAPAALAPRVAALAAEIAELVPVCAPADRPLIKLLAWQLARVEAVNAWLDTAGIFDAKGTPQPILARLGTWETQAARLLDQLGMSPTARVRLGVDLVRGASLEQHLKSRYGAGGGDD